MLKLDLTARIRAEIPVTAAEFHKCFLLIIGSSATHTAVLRAEGLVVKREEGGG